jgi:hypothetical protein
VLVGNRQRHRERDAHVTAVTPVKGEIAAALRAQVAHGRWPASKLYGDGFVAERLAAAIEELRPYVQKHLAFASDD